MKRPSRVSDTPCVGIIANPVSARDIRRIVAYAGNLQIAERANIILRVLAGLAAAGIRDVVMMPEKAGIHTHLSRALARADATEATAFPRLSRLNMPVEGHAGDSIRAAAMMRDMGVRALVLLGGDGTHRVVIKSCDSLPIAGISTGTNNAFPEIREPTITGLAVGLAVTGRIPPETAFRGCKRLDIQINDCRDVALVDVAVVDAPVIGARALWKPSDFRELFVTFGEPGALGMSALVGLSAPVSRRDPFGRYLRLTTAGEADHRVSAPIAPGIIKTIGIADNRTLAPGIPVRLTTSHGALALDGEREITFGHNDIVTVTLRLNAFQSVDVSACMNAAAERGLFIAPTLTPPPIPIQGDFI